MVQEVTLEIEIKEGWNGLYIESVTVAGTVEIDAQSDVRPTLVIEDDKVISIEYNGTLDDVEIIEHDAFPAQPGTVRLVGVRR